MNASMFFAGWAPIGRTIVVGACAYVALVLLLRVSGKRTLAKLNAFDLVVTVALGSTLASVLTSSEVALAQGIAAFVLLVLMQLLVTYTATRSSRVRDIVTAEPRLLVHRGRLLRSALRDERVGEMEVHAAVRAAGHLSLADVVAVVLETDGTVSVVAGGGSGDGSLEGVRGYPPKADAG